MMTQNLFDLFKEVVYKDKDKIALIYQNKTTTYAELSLLVDNIASRLQTFQVPVGEPIGILLDSTVYRVAALLAVLKLGNVFMPLSVRQAGHTFDELRNSANINCVIYSKELMQYSNILQDPHFVDIDALVTQPMVELDDSEDFEARRGMVSDAAYLMQTSGSTGPPKIVIGTHSGTINRLKWGWKTFPYDSTDVCCHKTSLMFVDSIAEIFSPLLSGIKQVIFDDRMIFQLDFFSRVVSQNKISRLTLVPSILQAILNDHKTIYENFQSVRIWITSGDELAPLLTLQFKTIYPDSRLINLYGSTEVSADCSYYEIKDTHSDAIIPIGCPIDNMLMEIIDENDCTLSVESPGEIAVTGVGVSPGYYPYDLSKKNNFTTLIDGKQWYMTGDLGYKDDKGLFYTIGRKDDMVNISGIKYNLKEVARKIWSIPELSVDDIFLTSIDNENSKQLILYIVCSSSEALSSTTLIQSMLAKRYGYSLPLKIIFLSSMPKTLSNKIDKLALKQSFQSNKEIAKAHDSLDKRLSQLWASILRVDKIENRDNFFALGGNSICAMHLIANIRNKLSIDANIHLLFHYPVFKDFYNKLKLQPQIMNIKNRTESRTASHPLTKGQQHILLSSLVSENPHLFNIVVNVTLDGDINYDKLVASLDEIWNKHDGLRTVFTEKAGVYYQEILSMGNFPTEIIEEYSGNTLESMISKARYYDFDFINGPLAKCFLNINKNCQSYIVIVFHHILIDDISINILLKEISIFYNSHLLSQKSTVVRNDLLGNIALLQANEKRTKSYKKSLEYWANKLNKLDKLFLPIDFPARALIRNRGDHLAIPLSVDQIDKIKALAHQHSLTPVIIIITVLGLLLRSYNPNIHIPLCMPMTTRGKFNDDNVVGCFNQLTTVVLKADFEKTFAENLIDTKYELLEVIAHKDVSLTDILTELRQVRSVSLSPFSNVMVVSQSDHSQHFYLEGTSCRVFETNVPGSNTDLSLIITEATDHLSLCFEYDTDIFNKNTIEMLVEQYTEILNYALLNPNKNIQRPEFYPQLNTIEPTKSYDEASFITEFEKRLKENPYATAVIHNEQHYSYDSLDKKSNQFANCLLEKRLERNDLIAIRCCRSFTMLVFILGSLKAGGCFLLLDPRDNSLLAKKRMTTMRLKFLVTSLDFQVDDIDQYRRLKKLSVFLEDYSQYSPQLPLITVKGADHCYYIQTSGTTGDPKLAMNHHRGLLYHIKEKAKILNLTKDDKVLQTASVQSDVVVWQLLSSLALGGSTVIIDNPLDFNSLINYSRNHKVSLIQLVPSIINLLIEYLKTHNQIKNALESVRWILSTGEILTPITVNNWLSCYPSIPIVNDYGPAECGDTISLEIVDHQVPLYIKIPLGKPFPGTQIRILDSDNQELPARCLGEISFSGPSVGYGYYRNDAMTAKKFIFDPRNPSQRIYLTGDQGKVDQHGKLIYAGRLDHQYKRFGYRFDINDISQAALMNSDIASAQCLLVQEKLVLFFTTNSQSSLKSKDLSEFLLYVLPAYALPDDYSHLRHFTYLPGGKIDMNALSQNYLNSETEFHSDCKSQHQGETIRKIFQKILRTNKICDNDNFFMLGGNSLDALRAVSEICSAFKVDFSLREILLSKNFENIISIIRERICRAKRDE